MAKVVKVTKVVVKELADDDVTNVAIPNWRVLRGYDDLLAQWRELVASDRLPSVLLLQGRAGLGKSHLAAALAAMIFCELGSACGQCDSCRELVVGQHPETIWLESESGKLLVEDAVRLQEHLALSPGPGARHRVAVIVDADQLMPQAANRLLKLLEEPPPAARIILTSSRPFGMLTTVRSRCVKWRVTPPSHAVSASLVASRLGAAGLAADAELVERILRRSGLAPGLALAACEAELEGDDSRSRAAEALSALNALAGSSDALAIVAAAEALAQGSGLSVAAILQEWEIDLNRSYRTMISERTTGRAVSPSVIATRRELLRRAKGLAIRGKVALNAQLTVEGLALS